MAQAQNTPERGLIRKLYKSILNGNMTEVRDQWSTITDLYGAVTPRGDNILHTAICMKHEDIAKEILKRCKEPERLLTKENALGDTVLHEAAATDMTYIARELLQLAPELLVKRNTRGETPLFRAAHYGKADTFRALADKLDEEEKEPEKKMAHLKRHDGTTILHITILAEFFDLALEIAKRYPGLIKARDENGIIGLQLISSNPSAFKSGRKYGFFRKFIYYCIPSDHEDTKKEKESDEKGTHESDQRPKLQFISVAVRKLISGWPVMERIRMEKRKHKSALKLAEFLIVEDLSWELESNSIEAEDRISIGKLASARTDEEEGNDKKKKDKKSLDLAAGTGGQPSWPWPEGLPTTVPLGSEGTSNQSSPALISLLLATSNGIVEIVKKILDVYPQAVEHESDMGQNILHVAIQHRQLEIFRIVKHMEIARFRLVRQFDHRGYTILHHVGVTKFYTRSSKSGPAFQLQEELRWFKRVEKMIPSHYAMHCSKEKEETAQEFFERTHKKLLKEAKEWLKRTSESCSTVAVLIATVAFAAAYTVPGGSDQETGTPILLCDTFFLIFTCMDVLSLASSLTSVVMFLSILTSPFDLQDFRHSLPRKLIIGFSFLFFSVAVTMLAFAATIVLIIHLRKRLSRTLIYTAAFLPVSFFALLQFPLYVASLSILKFTLKLIRKVIPRRLLPSCLQKTITPSIYKTKRCRMEKEN